MWASCPLGQERGASPFPPKKDPKKDEKEQKVRIHSWSYL